jgi:hypothetical protein
MPDDGSEQGPPPTPPDDDIPLTVRVREALVDRLKSPEWQAILRKDEARKAVRRVCMSDFLLGRAMQHGHLQRALASLPVQELDKLGRDLVGAIEVCQSAQQALRSIRRQGPRLVSHDESS